jgi:hypothetical protein
MPITNTQISYNDQHIKEVKSARFISQQIDSC